MTHADYLMRLLALAFLYLAVVTGGCAWRDDSAIVKVIAGGAAFSLVGAAVCFWRGGKPDPQDAAMMRRSAERAERGQR